MEEVYRITVEPAQNGFLVYLNENIILGGVRQQPYVFETMENLLKFIELKIKGTNGI